MRNKLQFTLSAVAIAVLLLGVYSNAQLRTDDPGSTVSRNLPVFTVETAGIGKVKAKGAFTADFALPGNLPLDQVAPVIEIDRMHMAARPGMQNKYLPIRFD